MTIATQNHTPGVVRGFDSTGEKPGTGAQAGTALPEGADKVIVRVIKKTLSHDIEATKTRQVDMFQALRSAGSIAAFAASCSYAETQVMESEKVGTMKDLARKYGIEQLSYTTVKSMLTKYAYGDKREKGIKAVNALVDFYKANDMGDKIVDTGNGFLDAWSDMYKDELAENDSKSAKLGVSVYRNHVKLADGAEDELRRLQNEAKRLADKASKEQQKLADAGKTAAAGVGTGPTATTPPGTTTGTGMPVSGLGYDKSVFELPESIKAHINRIMGLCELVKSQGATNVQVTDCLLIAENRLRAIRDEQMKAKQATATKGTAKANLPDVPASEVKAADEILKGLLGHDDTKAPQSTHATA